MVVSGGAVVVVVGGGLGGMSTALRLAERGQDVVLLEAEFCGHGASSRNAGQRAGAPGGPYDVIARAEADTVDALGRMVVSKVQMIDGITRTLTCPVVNI